MKKNKNSNSGFTLVELIIAMAILAFLMTAVSSLMGTSVSNYKKTKADTELQAASQETYNQISDNIMQATRIIVVGYPVSGLDFDENGSEVELTGDSAELNYYMLGTEDEKTAYAGKKIVEFGKLSSSTEIAVKQIIVENAVPLDLAAANQVLTLNEWAMTNALTSKNVKVKKLEQAADGSPILDTNDTVRLTYTFEGNKMYLEREYAFMTTKNDKIVGTAKQNNLYTDSLAFLKTTGSASDELSGCVMTINPDSASVGLSIYYNDKNATVSSKGYVSARNTYVFKEKSAVTPVGGTTEETTEATTENAPVPGGGTE